MIYLSGHVRDWPDRPEWLGAMLTPDSGYRAPASGWWAMDNACFADPWAFDFERYERYIWKCLEAAGDRCLFITVPDVPFDADGTMARLEKFLPPMKAAGWRTAAVTQDGMHPEDLPWGDLDALFVGGTTEWKMGHESGALINEARRRGLWVHMGRANSLKRMRIAASMGCQSVDGTFLARAPDFNLGRMRRWFEEHERQPVMRLS